MREKLKNKNNIILGSLLAVVLLLAVGYAAFATNLNIGGASNIDTSWDILITNLTSTTTGTASDNNSTYDRLTANLSANLVAPGDSITYEVTVTNRGSLDAILSSIEKTTVTNDYISVTYSGLTENDPLYKNESRKLIITVAFKNVEVSNLTTTDAVNFSVTLNYTQKTTQFDPEQLITISYNANGGTCDNCENVQMRLSDTFETFPTVTKLGFSFKYWYGKKQASIGDKVIRVVGEDVEETATLTAFYEQKKYRIKYDNQGLGSAKSTRNNQSWTAKSLSGSSTVSGYDFLGIYTTRDTTGLKVTNTTTVGAIIQAVYGEGHDEGPNGELEAILYYVWSENHYNFVYDSQGGDEVSSEYYATTDTLKTPTISKAGYTFDGWYSRENGQGVKINDGDKASKVIGSSDADGATKTLYAHWIEN